MKKHLEFYKACTQSGFMPAAGLCGCADLELIDHWLLETFHPNFKESVELDAAHMPMMFWGVGISYNDPQYNYAIHEMGFTHLRQTIVLFMAALNNEL